MISLACEFKDLINVFSILTESPRILILVFHIYLHLIGLAINCDSLTLRVVDEGLVNKSVENRFWDMLIGH